MYGRLKTHNINSILNSSEIRNDQTRIREVMEGEYNRLAGDTETNPRLRPPSSGWRMGSTSWRNLFQSRGLLQIAFWPAAQQTRTTTRIRTGRGVVYSRDNVGGF